MESLGPQGGNISILRGTLDDKVLLAATYDGSLFRTTDGGDSWNKIILSTKQKYQGPHIRDIVFHPFSDDTILVVSTQGLFRSFDKGITWVSSKDFPQPTEAVAYAASAPAILFGADDFGVLKSSNGGLTWMPLKDNKYFGNRAINHVAVHPADKNNFRVFVSTAHDDTTLATKILWTRDGGVSWQTFTKGLSSLQGNPHKILNLRIDTLGIGKKDFRLIAGTPEGLIFVQSDLKDTTWGELKNSSSPVAGVISDAAISFTLNNNPDSSLFQIYVAAKPSDFESEPKPFEPNVFGLYKVSASTKSPPTFWSWNNVFKRIYDVNAIHISYLNGTPKIYIATSDGIYTSFDGGLNWSSKNFGIANQQVIRPVSSPGSGNVKFITIGSMGGGIKRSTDNGVTWNLSNTGMNSPYIFETVTDPKNPSIIFATTPNGVSRSINAGATWNSIFSADSNLVINWDRFTNEKNEITLRISPVNSRLIFISSRALGYFLNTDGGLTNTWKRITPPVGDTLGAIQHIQFDPIDQNTIYLGFNKLWKSTNLGTQWQDISGNLPRAVNNIATQSQEPISYLSVTVNPNNPQEMFLPSMLNASNGIPFHLFHTINGGATWDSLPARGVSVMLDDVDPSSVLCTGPVGIFYSSSSGASWTQLTKKENTDSVQYLLASRAFDSNYVYYVGSTSGAHKLVLTNYSHFQTDTLVYSLGLRYPNESADTVITIRNPNGGRRLTLQLENVSDTVNFKYFGIDRIAVNPDSMKVFKVSLSTKNSGVFVTVLTFKTNDPVTPRVSFVFSGSVLGKIPLEKLNYDFGGVLVGKDSTISFFLDNKEGTGQLRFTLQKNSDTANFHYRDSISVNVSAGKTATVSIRFTPISAGLKQAYLVFSTTDPRIPFVTMKFQGIGVIKNFISRSVLIDTALSIAAIDSLKLPFSYSLLAGSLRRAGINTTFAQQNSFSKFNAVIIANPQKSFSTAIRDSLEQFVAKGGLLVLLGNGGTSIKNTALNEFLSHSSWQQKFKEKTGLLLNNEILFDSTISKNKYSGNIIATPQRSGVYLTNVDTIVMASGAGISVDSSSKARAYFLTQSKKLYSQRDSSTVKVQSAVVGATTKIGSGTIILLSDYLVWWNGDNDSVDNFGVRAASNMQFALNIFGVIDNYIAQMATPVPKEKYSLITIPYDLTDSLAANVFKDLGPPNKYVWRMFGRWSDKRRAYKEFPEDFVGVKQGEGYWLITKNEQALNFGAATVPGVAEDFSITLQPGWNMIGNPFPYRVSWKNSYRDSSVESVLNAYHSKYVTVTSTMEPFEGYFIKNRASTTKIIKISSTQITTPKTETQDDVLESGEWKIHLTAQSPSAADDANYIGMLKKASDDIDDYDYSEPPTAPEAYVSLAFLQMGNKLNADFKSISSKGATWDFTITSSEQNIPMTLSMTLQGMLPAEFKKYLVDFTTERVIDVSNLSEYSFNLNKNESTRLFRLIIGTQNFVEKNTNGIPIIPLVYSLEQNFPNPFNPSTTIRYSLSHSANTRLEIYNILGQKIKTLVNQLQNIGVYSVEWDGTNDFGEKAASGVYYYRIETEEFSAIKKMTLIK